MKYFIRSRHHELLGYLFVALCALVAKRWVMSSSNVFMMDDYSTLLVLSKIGHQGVTLLPQTLYNDRPIGNLFYTLTANVFNLNYVLTHAVQVLIHIYNGCLVLYILRRFQVNRWAAVLGSCIFVAYPMSTMAVQWTAAIYDLLGGCFALSALALYCYHLHDSNRMRYFTPAMLLLLYWLAVRTKEATIFLPVLLAMLALYDAIHYRRFTELRRNLIALAPAFVLFIIIFFTFINLKFNTVSATTADPKSQYFLDFSPLAMGRKFLEYLNLYAGRHWGWLPVILLPGLILVPRLKFALLWVMLGTALLIILPMKNNTHPLYLYFPSFFLVMIFAETLSPAFDRLGALRFQPLQRGFCLAGAFLLLLGLLEIWFVHVDGLFLNQGPWLGLAKHHKAQHREFQKRVRTLAGNEKFLIYNVHNDAYIFSTYGPGYSIRLYTGMPKLTFDLSPKPTIDAATKNKYHVVIRCKKGELEFQKIMTGKQPVNYRVKFYDPKN